MSKQERKNRVAKPTPVTSWPWPMSPRVFKVYDKYADVEACLETGASTWRVPVQGRVETFRFASGAAGLLQQKLVMLTQADRSPSSISKFTRSLIANWDLYVRLLEGGPLAVKDHWDEHVQNVDTAKAGKTVLKLAAATSLSPWGVEHKDLVKGLDTKANNILLAQRGRIRRRQLLLDVEKQAELVKVLDTRSTEHMLDEWQAEGLAALALIFQHGMRPVQLLALHVEHVHLFKDAGGETVCVISFHQAKQSGEESEEREMVRQVKPEWVPPVATLVQYAKQAHRTRLFSNTSADDLWRYVKKVCAEVGVRVDFTPYKLRHTSAQVLADAGHSRRSIQWFLGHGNDNAATSYLRASRQQAELINAALGVSKLYDRIISLASGSFVSIDDLRRADEDYQIGAVVGNRLVAGIGLCKSRQTDCPFNPVTSCYGCDKFMPALDATAHLEAIAGMREQVLVYLRQGGTEGTTSYMQLMKALAGAQKALDMVRNGIGDHRA